MPSFLHPFVFEHAPVRGALVQIEEDWREMRALRDYPEAVAELLGEGLAATALLASTLKFDGALVMQMQSQGPVTLLVAECTSDFGMRGTAKWNGTVGRAPLGELLAAGRCAITLVQADARQSYQGVVDLTGARLAEALEHYMARSEQLDTRLWLCAGVGCCAGLMLQRVPDRPDADPDAWNRAVTLAATVTPDELAGLPAPRLLRRLFAEEDIRLFEARALRFHCSCSPERVSGMLVTLGRAEVESVLADEGRVEVTCEFCNRRYTFDRAACERLFEPMLRSTNPGATGL